MANFASLLLVRKHLEAAKREFLKAVACMETGRNVYTPGTSHYHKMIKLALAQQSLIEKIEAGIKWEMSHRAREK